jgi:hypothetical protein
MQYSRIIREHVHEQLLILFLSRKRAIIQMSGSTQEGRPVTCLGKCFDLIYDVFTLVLSLSDLVTDVIVAISFYQDDRMEFFWVCISIFFISLMCFSVGAHVQFDIVACCLKTSNLP